VAGSGQWSVHAALTTSKWTGTLVNGGLTIELERTKAVVTVRPRGVLDAFTAPDLRAALVDSVAEQTSGVVVDVSDLAIADDVGLTVLATVAQQNRHWPTVGLVVSGPSREFTAAAGRIGIGAYVPMCPNEEAALAELSRTPPTPNRREHIQPDRNAPGLARAAVQEFCADQGVQGNTEASELVTNAVVHAGTPIDLTLRMQPSLLHIAVRDASDGQVRITGPVDESAESGRGLVLVDALAASWGSFVPTLGKIVWATIRVRMPRNTF
jgi:anti-anti-sigma factor